MAAVGSLEVVESESILSISQPQPCISVDGAVELIEAANSRDSALVKP